MGLTAAVATPFAVRQRQRFVDHSTRAAGLAAREPAVDHGQMHTTGLYRVGELSAEFAERSVGQAPGESMVGHHPLDVQVLDGYRRLLAKR
jgi:hypothetical protein